MAIEIKVPDIGADEVEITEILVKVGDKVEAEQSLITVEGDKASMEVPSPQAGIVKEIKVSVGDKTQTGALIMIFDSADGAAAVSSFTLCSFLEEPQAVNRLTASIIVTNFTFLISMFFNYGIIIGTTNS